MNNPFQFRELPLDAPFCNRMEELKEIYSHAQNNANVVIYSPRRYGKTSLIKRVQDRVGQSGGIAVYIDFFGVTSIEDIASRMASKLYAYCKKNDSLIKKVAKFLSFWRPVMRPDAEYGIAISVEPTGRRSGEVLLEDTLSGFGEFISDVDHTINIAIDEFQEIVELRDSLKIEGLMRKHIQTHTRASYFFVGSRRRILKDIFNERKRPFYRSAINYPLKPLPADEAVEFICERFKNGGKICSEDIARRIVEKVRGYPYYIQRIPYSIFEVSEGVVTDEDYSKGFTKAIDEERIVFESMLNVLAPTQVRVLSALAEQPTNQPYASDYMSLYNLGAIGSIQGAIKRLVSLDYIEIEDKVHQVADPVFGIWLRHLKG